MTLSVVSPGFVKGMGGTSIYLFFLKEGVATMIFKVRH